MPRKIVAVIWGKGCQFCPHSSSFTGSSSSHELKLLNRCECHSLLSMRCQRTFSFFLLWLAGSHIGSPPNERLRPSPALEVSYSTMLDIYPWPADSTCKFDLQPANCPVRFVYSFLLACRLPLCPHPPRTKSITWNVRRDWSVSNCCRDWLHGLWQRD